MMLCVAWIHNHSIIALSKNMGLSVLAEGVETQQ